MKGYYLVCDIYKEVCVSCVYIKEVHCISTHTLVLAGVIERLTKQCGEKVRRADEMRDENKVAFVLLFLIF